MAHSNNIISTIKLPNGQAYEIHDASAIHNIEELGLSAALVFKGTKTTEAAILALTSAKVGDVYLSTDTNTEFVCVTAINGTANAAAWEKMGNIHDAASSTHTHSVTVTGNNAASAVTGTVTVPTVSKTSKYMTVTAAAGSVNKDTDSVLGANTTFNVTGGTATTTKIKATAQNAAVGADGTATVVTGYATPTKDSALGVDATFSVTGGSATTSKLVTTTVKNPTVTAVSIPNVTGNSEVKASQVTNTGTKTDGTAASWTASVQNGVLSFDWTANTPTTVTLPTFKEVTATNTTLGTALSASSVTTSNVTVATGSLASNGGGSAVATGVSAISVAVEDADAVSAITDLGTASTATALTGVKVTSQPTITITSGTTGDVSVATGVSTISVAANTDDTVTAMTGVTVGAPTVTLANDGTSSNGVAFVDSVTVGSTSASLVDGQAAAQKWTQASGTTGTPQ
jgi:hypothetical protein